MFSVDKDYIIKIRRAIHEYPETDFDLPKTVTLVKTELEKMGIPLTEKYGKSSVVGYINPNKNNFTIAIRADMDALNMTEKTDLPYKSKIHGKMHACGHDGHTAMLLGAAKYLKSIEKELNCRVKLIFQPSEEGRESGAMMMIKNGVMDDVDVIIGQHVETALNSGTLAVCKGYAQASSRNFKIEIFGRPAHCSTPHAGVDALAVAVRVYTELQFMLSREIDPKTQLVCNVGTLNAGAMQNNIADYAVMQGTVRAYDMKVDGFVYKRMQDIVKYACDQVGATYKITAPMKSVSLYNNPYVSDLIVSAMEKVVGKENIGVMKQKLGAEDFSRYLEIKPGVLFRLGIANEEKGITTDAHEENFDLDEDALELGAKTFVQFVLDNMNGIDKSKL
ncbi:MAG: amidohydrolase [Clostridia bacterium]|nr:amidohydrolase [Clostridia bacterium]